MPLVSWYKRYSVNNEELDNHHKNLFAIMNKMYDACLPAETMDCAEPIIEELIKYTGYHFDAEEKYMAEIGYKGIEDHIEQHRNFLEKLHELRNCKNKNIYDFKKEVLVLLGNWIIRHVTVEDKKYSQIP
jgi:hemerythrin